MNMNLDVIVSTGDKELDEYLATRGYTLAKPTPRAPGYWQLNREGHVKELVMIDREPLAGVAAWLDKIEQRTEPLQGVSGL